jgi:glycosyltransferase involved in cell wall biosynthesis
VRILFVHTGADLYGASRSLLRLAGRLVRDGHAAACLLPYEGPLRERLAAAGVDVRIDGRMPLLVRGELRGIGGWVRLAVRSIGAGVGAAATVREWKPDLVHTNTAAVVPVYGLVARMMGVPHVAHLRESFGDFGRLWKLFQWAVWLGASRIVAVSQAIADQATPAVRRRVVVIHNGFPREEFEPVPPERVERFRRQFGLGGCLLAGVVGRIKFKRKGQETFVAAAELLSAWHDRARFLIIGSPFPGNESHLRQLNSLVNELGVGRVVVLTGEVEDIKAAISALDVLVLPSGQPEPFGGVVVEAMALGRPVVGTRLGGTVEQVEDGVTGLLVPPDDPSALAEAIGRLFGSPERRAEMGRLGRERYMQRFEFDPFYASMMALYSALTGGSRKTSRCEDKQL